MTKIAKRVWVTLLATTLSVTAFAAPKKVPKETGGTVVPVLWQEPVDISTRDLISGPGGPGRQPHGPFKFVKEDLKGTNPKYVITDADGVKWKIKLGEEARPETAASRFVWAAGYFADEDYFLPDLKVDNMPFNLHRGENQVEPDGLMHNARLKRYSKDDEKGGTWRWKENPFTGTREFNGLRVMMALINNWDLKDVNNAVYESDGKQIYMISDLGASFGTTGRSITRADSKGNLDAYTASKFIAKVGPLIDFGTPSRPAMIHVIEATAFKSRLDMEWIGKQIPVADARWLGTVLAKLTPERIQGAFGAAGYSPREVVGFSKVVEERIADLNKL
jgi:hypothetical protein